MKISSFLLLIVISLFLDGCQSISTRKEGEKYDLPTFVKLSLGVDVRSSVKLSLGEPNTRQEGVWSYKLRKTPKLWLHFSGDRLTGASLSVWDGDLAEDLDRVLKVLKGNWIVIQEPMTNPHLGPSLCYLEDMEKGLRVEIHGYNKKVQEISKWTPGTQKSIKNYLDSKIGKEFCIAKSCSRVSKEGEQWNAHHCDWLKKIVSKNGAK